MDAEQIKEWIDFEQQAVRLVQEGSAPDETGVMRLLQFIILPSFDAATSWEICRKVSRSGDKEYFAITTFWNRDEDYKKFETPVERLKHPRALNPTIETMLFELASDAVESFLDKLKSVPIPAYVDTGGIGADGTSYEFSFYSFFVTAKYSWWEKPPAEWKQLGDTVSEFLKQLEELCSEEREKSPSKLGRV